MNNIKKTVIFSMSFSMLAGLSSMAMEKISEDHQKKNIINQEISFYRDLQKLLSQDKEQKGENSPYYIRYNLIVDDLEKLLNNTQLLSINNIEEKIYEIKENYNPSEDQF